VPSSFSRLQLDWSSCCTSIARVLALTSQFGHPTEPPCMLSSVELPSGRSAELSNQKPSQQLQAAHKGLQDAIATAPGWLACPAGVCCMYPMADTVTGAPGASSCWFSLGSESHVTQLQLLLLCGVSLLHVQRRCSWHGARQLEPWMQLQKLTSLLIGISKQLQLTTQSPC
jgi:hypothetical protein